MLQLQVFRYLSVHIVLGLQLPRKKQQKKGLFLKTQRGLLYLSLSVTVLQRSKWSLYGWFNAARTTRAFYASGDS